MPGKYGKAEGLDLSVRSPWHSRDSICGCVKAVNCAGTMNTKGKPLKPNLQVVTKARSQSSFLHFKLLHLRCCSIVLSRFLT